MAMIHAIKSLLSDNYIINLVQPTTRPMITSVRSDFMRRHDLNYAVYLQMNI